MQNKTGYIKDAYNYIGNKTRLLPQIEQNLDFNSKYLVDVFAGSGVVSANFGSYFEKTIVNDRLTQLTEIQKYLYKTPLNTVLDEVDKWINLFDLSKTNKEGFIECRKYYNEFHKDGEDFNPMLLLTLIYHSFNYQIGFNSNGEFNLSHGYARSSFNPSLKDKLIKYTQKIQTLNLDFTNYCFTELIEVMEAGEVNWSGYMFYLDPPYFSSDSSYSRTRAIAWSERLEIELYETLDLLNVNGSKFLLSNTVENNGRTNKILKEWMSKYNVVEIDLDYKGCNYQRKNNGKTREVMVKNYV